MITKQIAVRLKIRSVSDPSAVLRVALSTAEGRRHAQGVGPHANQMITKQMVDHLKIRSVSDGSARGWGPARIK